ncbi:MAG TPA: PP2C family protein-serine/threonine phosphatase [Clostridia bacterium]|nr:PP2C family protein-serine/threonine phosphatase [Clostridia bacterium]
MEKADVKNVRVILQSKELPEIIKIAIFQVVSLIFGLAAARAQIFGGLSPFAVAFVATVPSKYALAAVIGGSVGSLATVSASTAVQSIAAMAAAAAINTTVSRFISLRENRIIAPCVASICCLASGITTMLAVGFTLNGTMLFVCEAVLAGGAAYFIKRTMEIKPMPTGGFCLSNQETACVIITACIFVMSLSVFSVKGFVPARLLSAFVIILFACFSRETGGSIAGICAGVCVGFATNNPTLAATFALGGLLAGIFSPLGRLACSGAFVVVCGVSALVSNEVQAVSVLIEAAIACVIFCAIPPQKLEMLKKYAIKTPTPAPEDSNTNAVVMKLNNAATAINGVSDYIEKVSCSLNRLAEPENEAVFLRVREEVCSNCGLLTHCWSNCNKETQQAFNELVDIIKNDECLSTDMLSEPLSGRCIRAYELTSSFNKHYLNMVAKRGTAQRISQIREVVSDQFESVSDLLKSMAKSVGQTVSFEPELSRLASEVCESFDIRVYAVSCLVNELGRMSLSIQTGEIKPTVNKTQLTRAISKACDRELDLPCIVENPEYTLMTFSQRASIKVKLGAAQIPCKEGEYCGDYFECFEDGNGHEVIILSDGMGTGDRAAVDAALATEIFSSLVKAGLGFDCALRLTNSALLVKGIDESLSTLDVVSIDLFSGKAEFSKAGGAMSFVRKKNKVAALELSALPAGILREVNFEKAYANLETGDIVVMVSDGIIGNDHSWIMEELKIWRGNSAQELAQRISEMARRQKVKGRQDDMTVICAIID